MQQSGGGGEAAALVLATQHFVASGGGGIRSAACTSATPATAAQQGRGPVARDAGVADDAVSCESGEERNSTAGPVPALLLRLHGYVVAAGSRHELVTAGGMRETSAFSPAETLRTHSPGEGESVADTVLRLLLDGAAARSHQGVLSGLTHPATNQIMTGASGAVPSTAPGPQSWSR